MGGGPPGGGLADSHAGRRRLLGAIAALTGAAVWPALRAQTVDEFASDVLKGAGSTFAHPLLSAWARDYRSFRTGEVGVGRAGGGLDDEIGGVALDYEAVGSQAGIQRVTTRAVDFAVSEMPLSVAELRRSNLLQVPLVAGAVAVAVNVAGLTGRELRLSPAVLADVFLGRVTAWNDAAIAGLNPGVTLPAAPIAVLHRADGSGTTFTFTAFLAGSSADWKGRVGSDLRVKWPVGTGHRGSAGVAGALQRTPNSIGYLDLVQALGNGLAVASVQNASGRFVAPAAASVQAALADARWDADSGFSTSLVNRRGDGAYPIVAAVYGVANRPTTGSRSRMTRAFFDWSLTRGRATAEKLGYVALPASTVEPLRASLR